MGTLTISASYDTSVTNLNTSVATDLTSGGQFTLNPAQIKLLDPTYATDGIGTT